MFYIFVPVSVSITYMTNLLTLLMTDINDYIKISAVPNNKLVLRKNEQLK